MIACDSWIITLLSKTMKEKGSAARYIGMIVGKGITYNLFIPLNSISFANNHIYSAPKNEALMSNSLLMKCICFVLASVLLFIGLFISEKIIVIENNV